MPPGRGRAWRKQEKYQRKKEETCYSILGEEKAGKGHLFCPGPVAPPLPLRSVFSPGWNDWSPYDAHLGHIAPLA